MPCIEPVWMHIWCIYFYVVYKSSHALVIQSLSPARQFFNPTVRCLYRHYCQAMRNSVAVTIHTASRVHSTPHMPYQHIQITIAMCMPAYPSARKQQCTNVCLCVLIISEWSSSGLTWHRYSYWNVCVICICWYGMWGILLHSIAVGLRASMVCAHMHKTLGRCD